MQSSFILLFYLSMNWYMLLLLFLYFHILLAGLSDGPQTPKTKKKTITRKSFIASCKKKPLKWSTLSGVRLEMCEEALSNQVKEKKKSFVRNRRK